MKRFSKMKLSRYTDDLIEADNILKIAKFLHANQADLSKYFDSANENMYGSTEDDSTFMYKSYRYLTGEKKTVHDYDEEGKKVEGTEREEDVSSSVDIFCTSESARKQITTYNIMNGTPVSLVFSPDVPTTYKARWINLGRKSPDPVTYKMPVFDEYSTVENLNKEAWLFRSMSLPVQLQMSYLAKHNCPGIDIYFSDIPRLLERLGLTPSTVEDIQELQ